MSLLFFSRQNVSMVYCLYCLFCLVDIDIDYDDLVSVVKSTFTYDLTLLLINSWMAMGMLLVLINFSAMKNRENI